CDAAPGRRWPPRRIPRLGLPRGAAALGSSRSSRLSASCPSALPQRVGGIVGNALVGGRYRAGDQGRLTDERGSQPSWRRWVVRDAESPPLRLGATGSQTRRVYLLLRGMLRGLSRTFDLIYYILQPKVGGT